MRKRRSRHFLRSESRNSAAREGLSPKKKERRCYPPLSPKSTNAMGTTSQFLGAIVSIPGPDPVLDQLAGDKDLLGPLNRPQLAQQLRRRPLGRQADIDLQPVLRITEPVNPHRTRARPNCP